MRISLLFVATALFGAGIANTQWWGVVPLSLRNGSTATTLRLGVTPHNTINRDVDTLLGTYVDQLAAPLPPSVELDSRFVELPSRTGQDYVTGLSADYRGFANDATVDSFVVQLSGVGLQNGLTKNPTVVQWPADINRYGTSWQIQSVGSSVIPLTDMLTTTSVTIPPAPLVTSYFVMITRAGAGAGDSAAAALALSVTGTGTLTFAEPRAVEGVTIFLSGVAGKGSVFVTRFPKQAKNVSFSGTPPARVSSYRWMMSQIGLTSFSAQLFFDIDLFPSGVTDPHTVTIYQRSQEGTGEFSPLPTTVDVVGRPTATVTTLGEFIFGIDGPASAPRSEPSALSFELAQNYPNPFNPSTEILFTIPKAGRVTLKVYNTLGQEVASLVNGVLPPGTHRVQFLAGGLPSGIYFYRIQAGEYSVVKRMVFMK